MFKYLEWCEHGIALCNVVIFIDVRALSALVCRVCVCVWVVCSHVCMPTPSTIALESHSFPNEHSIPNPLPPF